MTLCAKQSAESQHSNSNQQSACDPERLHAIQTPLQQEHAEKLVRCERISIGIRGLNPRRSSRVLILENCVGAMDVATISADHAVTIEPIQA